MVDYSLLQIIIESNLKALENIINLSLDIKLKW